MVLSTELSNSPVKTIHKNCVWCMGGSAREVTKCTSPKCPIFNYRMGKKTGEEKRTPLKAIKEFCIECFCDDNVKDCPNPDCIMYPFRLGRMPKK